MLKIKPIQICLALFKKPLSVWITPALLTALFIAVSVGVAYSKANSCPKEYSDNDLGSFVILRDFQSGTPLTIAGMNFQWLRVNDFGLRHIAYKWGSFSAGQAGYPLVSSSKVYFIKSTLLTFKNSRPIP